MERAHVNLENTISLLTPETYKVPHLELVTRVTRRHTLKRTKLMRADHLAEVATHLIGDKPIEHLIAICMDGQGNITGVITIAQGGIHGAAIQLADIFRAVLSTHAAMFVLAHNHPSGDPNPSAHDREFTESVRAASDIIGLSLVDHVVVTRIGEFTSMIT